MVKVALTGPSDEQALLQRPSVFLSASVPEKPVTRSSRREKLTRQGIQRSRRYFLNSRPSNIRRAVAELCRRVFRNDLNLIFGGHPAISPMVLRAAQLFSHGESDHPRVVVFQSEHFLNVIPGETKELAIWERGKLLTTADKGSREDSLDWMRRIMILSPGIVASIFIGGMHGVVEEYDLVKELRPDVPRIPIGSTGGAALDLAGIETGQFAHDSGDSHVSYPELFSELFLALKESEVIPGTHRGN